MKYNAYTKFPITPVYKKRFHIVLLAFVCMTFLGCIRPNTQGFATPNQKHKFPPSTGPIELYEIVPTQSYIVVGEVHAHGWGISNKSSVIEELKQQAGTIGADAVIKVNYSKRRNGRFAKGTAIRWK